MVASLLNHCSVHNKGLNSEQKKHCISNFFGIFEINSLMPKDVAFFKIIRSLTVSSVFDEFPIYKNLGQTLILYLIF